MNPLAEARRLTREDLKRSGLTEKDMLVVPAERDLFGNARIGYLIRYPDPKTGKPNGFSRYKYLGHPKGFDALNPDRFPKKGEYRQPADTGCEVYWPRRVDWAAIWKNPKEPLYITEGEKKAEAGRKAGLRVIGLGGVYNFRDSNKELLAALKEVDWKDRDVYIVFDSDAVTNWQVMNAENTLARELLRLGAVVYIVRLPEIRPEQKTGLDDFLVARGRKAFDQLKPEPWEESAKLHELNEKVIYVHNHSIYEIATGERIKTQEFVHAVYSDWIYNKPAPTAKNPHQTKETSAAREWLKWPGRAKAPGYVYEPGQPWQTADGSINNWRGWGIPESLIKPGDLTLWNRLLELQFSDPEDREYFLQWLAYPLQYPGTKMQVAVLNWGVVHGTGKDLIGVTMDCIYGTNAVKIRETDLEKAHNELLENRQFVRLEELTGGDKNRRTVGDQFKTLISQQTVNIDPKFLRPYSIKDCMNYYITSNHADPIHLEPDDRRWFVNQVTSPRETPEFYREYDRWYRSDDVGALFYHLRLLPLKGFNPNGPARETAAKRSIIGGSTSDPAMWAQRLREEPDSVLYEQRRDSCEVLPYSLMRLEELWSLFRRQLPDNNYNKNKRILVAALTENGIRRANKEEQVRIEKEGWGKHHLWMVRNPELLGKAKEKQLAKTFLEERKKFEQKLGQSLPALYRAPNKGGQ